LSATVFTEYLDLRRRVTGESDELFSTYSAQVSCRRGCYYCCDDISVLPIEYEALRRSLGQDGFPARDALRARRRCAFLGREGECTVYAARPVICRTHGLPLAYRLFEYDADGRLVSPGSFIDSWCDLNFTDLADRQAAAYFDRHGRINMARINEALEDLNGRFLAGPDGASYRGRDWIKLSELVVEREPR
jgi:Fe-S-cluster containining protein